MKKFPKQWRIWKIRSRPVHFPYEWNKDEVMDWLNDSQYRICPFCNRRDVKYDHFNICDPEEERIHRLNNDMNEGL